MEKISESEAFSLTLTFVLSWRAVPGPRGRSAGHARRTPSRTAALHWRTYIVGRPPFPDSHLNGRVVSTAG